MPAGLVSPVESITLALDRWRAGDGVEVLRSEFLDVLASVPDPRDPRGRRYPLAGLLAISILATAAGMRGYAGFATWAATAPAEVRSRLGLPCAASRVEGRVSAGREGARIAGEQGCLRSRRWESGCGRRFFTGRRGQDR